jgi:hypothetical protein
MGVQFIWRYHDTRPGFLNLAAERGIEADQMHFAAGQYQCQSVSKLGAERAVRRML